MSNLDILRQASQEVDLETSQTSLDGLLDSVQEVAIERGFKSPNRQRSFDSLQSAYKQDKSTSGLSPRATKDDLNRLENDGTTQSPRRASPPGKVSGGSPRTAKNVTSPSPTKAAASSPGPETYSKTTSNIPAQKGLYGKMRQFGKESVDEEALEANERIDDDLNAMVKSLKSEGIVDDNFKLKPKKDDKFVERKKQALYRYNQHHKMRSKEANDFDNRLSARKVSEHVKSEPSRISQLLDKYDDDEAEKAPIVHSMTQEMLFRSMKLLEPKDAGKTTKGKSKMISRVSAKSGNNGSTSTKGKSIREDLCQPKESHIYGRNKNKEGLHPTQVHATYDDAKNCHFRPKIKKSPHAEINHNADAKDSSGSSFFDRQEMMYRSKMNRLEESIGQRDYNAKIDKRYCPKCGAQQKYDEVVEKKKKCPVCNVTYMPKISWAQVGSGFFDKNKVAVEKMYEKLHNPEIDMRRAENDLHRHTLKMHEDIRKKMQEAIDYKHMLEKERNQRHVNITKCKAKKLELDPEVEYKKMVELVNKYREEQTKEKDRLKHLVDLYTAKWEEFRRAEDKYKPKDGMGFTKKKWDSKLQNEFFQRMEDQQVVREEKVEMIEDEVYTQKYPFKPTIHKRPEDEIDDENYDPIEEFLNRYESDMETRKERSKHDWSESRWKLEAENTKKYGHDKPFKV